MNLKVFQQLFSKTRISIFKICKNVFITHEIDSKLLKMYDFDYLNHRDVNYYVSEHLYVKMKSAQKS